MVNYVLSAYRISQNIHLSKNILYFINNVIVCLTSHGPCPILILRVFIFPPIVPLLDHTQEYASFLVHNTDFKYVAHSFSFNQHCSSLIGGIGWHVAYVCSVITVFPCDSDQPYLTREMTTSFSDPGYWFPMQGEFIITP